MEFEIEFKLEHGATLLIGVLIGVAVGYALAALSNEDGRRDALVRGRQALESIRAARGA